MKVRTKTLLATMPAPTWIVLACLILFAASSLHPAQAQSNATPSEQHGPPPEAIAACGSLAANATCSFTGRGGHAVSGVCEKDEHDASSALLSCRPSGMPQGSPPPAR